MKVKIQYNDSFSSDDSVDCVEYHELKEFTGIALASAMQHKACSETGLNLTYTTALFKVVNPQETIAAFCIIYKEPDDQRIVSHLTGVAFNLG